MLNLSKCIRWIARGDCEDDVGLPACDLASVGVFPWHDHAKKVFTSTGRQLDERRPYPRPLDFLDHALPDTRI